MSAVVGSQQGDSGHETLVSEGEEETPRSRNLLAQLPPTSSQQLYHHHPPVERASSEVIYSTITNNTSNLGTRSRRSLAEPPTSGGFQQGKSSVPIYEDIDNPPRIAPISGVPNLKGKAVIRPIAFRPTTGVPHGIAPTPPVNNNLIGPPVYQPPPSQQPQHLHHANLSNGFAPGHPLVKDGRRHYGSSQELHVHPQAPSSSGSGSFNKFNSLDRRALARRQNLKLAPEPSAQPQSLIVTSQTNKSRIPSGGEPKTERKLGVNPTSNNRFRICDNNNKLSAMNINGLPDPSVYSSQESIHRLPRPGAGTPQFQNLSGVVRARYDHHSSLSSNSSSSAQGDVLNQTPSPSDSAVGDLEHMLKEKDSEIHFLRETMEQNEQVIFKVYEEKEKMWERELRKIKGLYDNRLRASQQKSAKMEQALSNQTYYLQNDKRKLELDIEDMKRLVEEKQKENESLRMELNSLRKNYDQNDWPPGVRKNGEISSLHLDHDRNQFSLAPDKEVRSLATEIERKDSEISCLKASESSLRNEVSSLKSLLNDKSSFVDDEDEETDVKTLRNELASQKEIIISRDLEIEKLRDELENLRVKSAVYKEETDKARENFEVEKAHWLDEKEKVIRYQKQLQLNYVQMYKKNKHLEAEVDNLDKKLSALPTTPSPKKTSFLSHLNLGSKNSSINNPETQLSSGSANGNSSKSKFFKMTLHAESHC